MLRIAIDIGGGFADLAAIDLETGEMMWAKTYTTPSDLQQCVKEVFKQSDVEPTQVSQLMHGQTLVINAILQRSGAKTGLITTKGFRDILGLQRANRRDIFNLRYKKPIPFVSRELRAEVGERVSAKGEILAGVSPNELRAAYRRLRELGAETVAISYINSYANPANELESRKLIQQWREEGAGNEEKLHLTISSDLCREWREYERTSTAVLNAYVMPAFDKYITELGGEFRKMGIAGALFMMLSNGGVASFGYAAKKPIHTVESGPVAGIVGAVRLGEAIGERNIIAMDGGSTTTKASLVRDLKINYMGDYAVERDEQRPGYPIKVPVADIVEIPIGGGSLVWVNEVEELRVGPGNVGATIGPAAYGRGGTNPSLTDAYIALGLLNPTSFLGGSLHVSRDLAERSLEQVAAHFKITVQESANAALRIAADGAASLLRLISVQRGHDPRDFSLFAYGGSGPMIAGFIADELEIPRVVVPGIPPGNFSSWGLLMSDLKHTAVLTHIQKLGEEHSAEVLDDAYQKLEEEILGSFREEGVAEGVECVRFANLRYYGQEHTLNIEVASGPIQESIIQEMMRSFRQLHRQQYGFELNSNLEIVDLIITGTYKVQKPSLERKYASSTEHTSSGTPIASSRVVYWPGRGVSEVAIYQRAHLFPGMQIEGPAIVEESTTTILIPETYAATTDEYGNLVLKRRV